MDIKLTKEEKTYINPETKQKIDYVERNIVIDGTPYKVGKQDAKIFDYQFKDEIEYV